MSASGHHGGVGGPLPGREGRPHQVFVEHVEEALREFADEDVQRRLWLSSSGEVSSFVECWCQLYDDSGLGDALDRPGVVFTEEVDTGFRRLNALLERVDTDQPVETLLRDPALTRVRDAARALLEQWPRPD